MNLPNSLFRALRAGRFMALAVFSLLLAACATQQPGPQFDYTAFKASKPRSILVLPPVNQSPDVDASASLFSVTTYPLAESGYYVIPITLTEETFKQNGVTVAEEAHSLPLDKLREIFGADAALYITITRYGVSYRLIDSVVEIAASAKLVDLRNAQELWQGSASIAIGQNNSNSGLVGMLVGAVVNQIVNNVSDRAHEVAGTASRQLFWGGGHSNRLLLGPYHPKYGTE
ncbi:putative lipoprotein [Betaproteobacteria bacterium]|nr:putative lipoprotein [Betaproteobacteria bacterium]